MTSNACGAYLFGKDPSFFSIQDIARAKKDGQKPRGKHGDVIGWVFVKNIQIEWYDVDIVKSGVFKDLAQGIFGERIMVVEVLRQRFGPCYRVGAVQGEANETPVVC